MDITNDGPCSGDETVQLYVRDDNASVSLPVKELKGFQRIHLEKGQSEKVCLSISDEQLMMIGADGEERVEP